MILIYIQSTPLIRATSGPGCFDPIKRRNILTQNIVSQTVIPLLFADYTISRLC